MDARTCSFKVDDYCFTGSVYADVLLVGDCLAGPNDLSVPFYANTGSSLYLAQTLQEIAADESKVAIVNVNDPTGVSTVRLLSPNKRVIALGKEAEKTLLREKITYDAAVRHPQHARRFTHNDGSYALEMRAAFNNLAGVKRS
jgi:uracil-DNA glycosylase